MAPLGQELQKNGSDLQGIRRAERDVHVGSEIAVGVDADTLSLARFVEYPEGADVLVRVHFVSDMDAFDIDKYIQYGGFPRKAEVSDDADKDEGNGHDRALRRYGVDDDCREEEADDEDSALVLGSVFVFAGAPRDSSGSICIVRDIV